MIAFCWLSGIGRGGLALGSPQPFVPPARRPLLWPRDRGKDWPCGRSVKNGRAWNFLECAQNIDSAPQAPRGLIALDIHRIALHRFPWTRYSASAISNRWINRDPLLLDFCGAPCGRARAASETNARHESGRPWMAILGCRTWALCALSVEGQSQIEPSSVTSAKW